MKIQGSTALKKPKHIKKKPLTKRYQFLIFIFPWLIGVCAFFIYPLITSVRLSFSKITTLFNYRMGWVGLENYRKALLEDIQFVPLVLQSLKTVALFTPAIILISMVLAILLNSRIKLRGYFRSIFFLPVLLGTGYVMNQLIGSGVNSKAMEVAKGIIMPDGMTQILGPGWTSTIGIILSSITLILWKSGIQVLLFLGGLQSIPGSVYESARVDAATDWEIFWKITMPMLSPITVLAIVYTIIDSFTDISTPVISYILEKSSNYGDMGFVSAMSWIYLSIVMLVVGIVYFSFRKHVNGVYDSQKVQ